MLEEAAKLTYEEWFLRFRIDGQKLDINPETKLPLGNETFLSKFNIFKQLNQKVNAFEGQKKYYATADIDGTFISGDGEVINWHNKPSYSSTTN